MTSAKEMIKSEYTAYGTGEGGQGGLEGWEGLGWGEDTSKVR